MSALRLQTIVHHVAGGARGGAKTSTTGAQSQGLYVTTEVEGAVGIVRLNRPKALNALCDPLMAELSDALAKFDASDNVRCCIITGNGRAFAAGADISEMEGMNYHAMSSADKFGAWNRIRNVRIPIIAAVNGFALGGGCEVAMMCDIIIASEKAKFGQPEILIGTIPGAGGTQRLPRAIGKSKAMELVLTGGQMSAHDAERAGLVSRVVPHEQLMPEALKVAAKIASLSRPVVAAAKKSVNAAYNTTLQEGMNTEQHLFQGTFALDDQTEGMNAFISKRKPNFQHR